MTPFNLKSGDGVWIDSVEIPGTYENGISDPQLDFDCNGNVIIVWKKNDGSNTQIYYPYLSSSITIKNNINIKQEYLKFLTQENLINVLQWENLINNAVKYKIYCKFYTNPASSDSKILIGEIEPPINIGGFKNIFFHHNRLYNQNLTYYITAIDNNGD